MKAKILNVMDKYLLSNLLFFVEGGQNGSISPEIQSQISYRGLTMT